MKAMKKNPLSNGESAVMLVLGAAAIGALVYAIWPKSAAPSLSPAPSPLPPSPSPTPAPLPVSNARTVTLGDDGRTVTLKRGDTLIVRLPQLAGTGYVWGYEINGSPVVAVDLDKSFLEGGSNPGDAQTVVEVFNVIATGRAVLKATSRRGTSIGQTFSLTIDVPSSGIEV